MKKIGAALIIFPVLALLSGCGYRGGGCFGPGMMGHGYFMGHGGGFIMWILIIAAIGAALFFGYRYYEKEKGGGESALDILKKRYARGEITQEEFEKMKKEI